MKKHISIIGAGFSSLASACYLAKAGYNVEIFEKNNHLGGRAKVLEQDDFKFDMGPTWYWMPDIFEDFFNDFDKDVSQYYKLHKLDPAYEVFFDKMDSVKIFGDTKKIEQEFERIEKGSGKKLNNYLKTAKENYEFAVGKMVHKPGRSPLELLEWEALKKIKYVFWPIRKLIARQFSNTRLKKILEFPVLFLGSTPSETPALYNFMNWADFGLGTWHPEQGMSMVSNAMVDLAKELGVTIHKNSSVEKIHCHEKMVKHITVNGENIATDIVVSGADYYHTENLLDVSFRQYSKDYWKSKQFAPSALLFYLGFNKKIKNVSHHTLFFDTEFDEHAVEIYKTKQWPKNPLFYASFPTITDKSFAPQGCESCTILIPLANDIDDSPEMRSKYREIILDRLESLTDQSLKDNIVVSESFCVNDFKSEYNSFGGNAYGLANTLLQTAFLRPKLESKKVNNLYFTGQLTVPGPGVPPAIISGKIVANLISENV